MEFFKIMSAKEDDELIQIVYLEAFNYQDEAVEAAESVLKIRMNESIKEKINLIKTAHFKPLEENSNEELIALAISLFQNNNKSEKEIRHIFKMGNISNTRWQLIQPEFTQNLTNINRENSSKKKLIGFLLFFGGIGATILSYDNVAVSGGTYYIFYGAIIFGLIYFFELV